MRKQQVYTGLTLTIAAVLLTGCSSDSANQQVPNSSSSGTSTSIEPQSITPSSSAVITPNPSISTSSEPVKENTMPQQKNITLTINGQTFNVELADTQAAQEFASRLPLTMKMEDMNSNEKHASLNSPLPSDDKNPGSINNGDILLWSSNTVVVFYKSFPTQYSYTPLGKIQDPSQLAQAVGPGDVEVTFAAAQ